MRVAEAGKIRWHTRCRGGPAAADPEASPPGAYPPEFYQAVAALAADQGYLSVTWQDVAAVHARVRQGEELSSVLDQVIAWGLWRQAQADDPGK